jgi:hypothetical protein
MIIAIPNQPIGFDPKRIGGCWNDDPNECLPVHTGDDLSFQTLYDPCITDNLVASPQFEDQTDFNFSSFVFGGGRACNRSGPTPGQFVADASFLPTVGQTYNVTVTIESITLVDIYSGVAVQFGGFLLAGSITSPGVYEWIVTATVAQSIRVDVNRPLMSVCLSYFGVYGITNDITVALIDGDDNVVDSWNNGSDPQYFNFDNDRLTYTMPVEDMGEDGCFRLRVTDACNNSVLTSQCLNIGDHSCLLKLTMCNSGPAIGFVGFSPTMRVTGKVTAPSFDYEAGEERLSDGTINRPYADRRMGLLLRVDNLGEYGHRALSTLPLWDHFYIGQDEYSAKADSYEPAYADVYDSTAPIEIGIEPKQDLARKIRVVEDNGGCKPPPNYLVQGSGPNENYVTQTDGSLILITT